MSEYAHLPMRCPFCCTAVEFAEPDSEHPADEFLICTACEAITVLCPEGDLRRPTETELGQVDWQRYRDSVTLLREKQSTGRRDQTH